MDRKLSLSTNDQDQPVAASDLAKCKQRTTATRVHFIVQVSRCRGGDVWRLNGTKKWSRLAMGEGQSV